MNSNIAKMMSALVIAAMLMAVLPMKTAAAAARSAFPSALTRPSASTRSARSREWRRPCARVAARAPLLAPRGRLASGGLTIDRFWRKSRERWQRWPR